MSIFIFALLDIGGIDDEERTPSARAMTPNGTLMKKIQCQDQLSVIQPPSKGPMMGPPRHPHAVNRGGHADLLDREGFPEGLPGESGCRAPPPMPCMTRKKTRLWRFQDRPQKSELTVKRLTESMR